MYYALLGTVVNRSTRKICSLSIGKYMYIDVSNQSPGDNAELQLAVSRSNSSSCLTFYYHMYGSNMGTLNVFNGNVTIFTKSGNQGNLWRKGTRTVHLSDVVNIPVLLHIITHVRPSIYMQKCCPHWQKIFCRLLLW